MTVLYTSNVPALAEVAIATRCLRQFFFSSFCPAQFKQEECRQLLRGGGWREEQLLERSLKLSLSNFLERDQGAIKRGLNSTLKHFFDITSEKVKTSYLLFNQNTNFPNFYFYVFFFLNGNKLFQLKHC